MNKVDIVATAIASVASIIAFWITLCWFYRSYRIDLFRHRLFGFRAELFDHALRGEIAFNDPAYVGLRHMLNGFLRFAERMSLSSFFLSATVVRNGPAESQAMIALRELDAAINRLDLGLRTELHALRSRVHVELFKQLLFSSPFLTVTLVAFLLSLLIRNVGKKLIWRALSPVYQACETVFEKYARPFDAVAFQMGSTA